MNNKDDVEGEDVMRSEEMEVVKEKTMAAIFWCGSLYLIYNETYDDDMICGIDITLCACPSVAANNLCTECLNNQGSSIL